MASLLSRLLPTALLLASAFAQAPAAAERPTRSLADGLVRQRIEIDGVQPPTLTGGLEAGRGEGPLVLLLRTKQGDLTVHEIQRGRGDHGPSPTPTIVDEVEEEVQAPPNGKLPAPNAAKVRVASLRVAREGEGDAARARVTAPDAEAPRPLAGAELREALQAMFAARKDTAVHGQLLLTATAEAHVQDVVAVWEVARAVGFDRLMLSGLAPLELADEHRELLDALPRRFGWRVEQRGAGGAQPVCDGELLVLLDGATRWGDFLPLYAHCAKVGIWRISLVGQAGERTRVRRYKLPIDLPFDRGL